MFFQILDSDIRRNDGVIRYRVASWRRSGEAGGVDSWALRSLAQLTGNYWYGFQQGKSLYARQETQQAFTIACYQVQKAQAKDCVPPASPLG